MDGETRRDFLYLAASGGILGLSGCSGVENRDAGNVSLPNFSLGPEPTTTSRPIAGFEAPETKSAKPVIDEAYGDFELNRTNPFREWGFAADRCFLLEYEIRSERIAWEGEDEPIDVLVVPAKDFEAYRDAANPRVVNGQPVKKRNVFQGERLSLSSSTSSGSIYNRGVMEPGEYYLVVDHTDINPTEAHEKGQLGIDAAVRTLSDSYEIAEYKAIQTVNDFYNALPGESGGTVRRMRNVADKLCDRADTVQLEQLDLNTTSESVSTVQEAIPAARYLIDELVRDFGLSPRLKQAQSLLNQSETCFSWLGSAIPIVGSCKSVASKACALADLEGDAKAGQIRERAKQLALSIGVLVAELILVYFGVSGSLARSVVGTLDDFLLAVLRATGSLRLYTFVQQELVLKFSEGFAEALEFVIERTRSLSEYYNFVTAEDIALIRKLLDLDDEEQRNWREWQFLIEPSPCARSN